MQNIGQSQTAHFEALEYSNSLPQTDCTDSTSKPMGSCTKAYFPRKLEFSPNFLKKAPQPHNTASPPKKKMLLEQPSSNQVFAEEPSKNQITQTPIKKPPQSRRSKLLQAPSLRERFGHLLPVHMRLKIGYHHIKLIQKMCVIDRCITILAKGVNRFLTFKQIQESARRSLKVGIEENDLKQIIYLNDNFIPIYLIEWTNRENTKEYDITIRLPFQTAYNQDKRKQEFRRAIHKFLMSKYSEHLQEKGIRVSQDVTKWEHGFNVQDVRIPLGNIPLHPLQKKISLKYLEKSKIEGIGNKNLKQIVEDVVACSEKKQNHQESEQKQKKSSLIFKNRLYKITKSKEELYQQEKRLSLQEEKPLEVKQLIKFCQQAYIVFSNRQVTTMFLMNFLEAITKYMEEDLRLPDVENILNQVLENDVKFLVKLPSPKGSMIQIKKEKYKQIMDKLQGV